MDGKSKMSEISKNIPVSRKKQRRHGNSHLNHLFGRIKRDMHRTARKRGRFKVNRRIEDAITSKDTNKIQLAIPPIRSATTVILIFIIKI